MGILRRNVAIKVLRHPAELIHAYRLRYQVFDSLHYLQSPNQSELELDEHDPYAIHFGAIAVHTGELVGTLRLIKNRIQRFYALQIHHILKAVDDMALHCRVARDRRRCMPSIISEHVQEMIREYNVDDQEVEELSRTVVHPRYRGSGISRGLMEFGLAYATAAGDPVLIGGCIPEHVPMYAKYGYTVLPGTALDRYDTTGQNANTVVCNTRRLPEPTRSRVAMLLRARSRGESEANRERRREDEEHLGLDGQ